MSNSIAEFSKLVSECGILVFDTETTGLDFDSKFISISMATGNIEESADPVVINLDARDFPLEHLISMIKPLFENEETILVGHNIKYDLIQLGKLGIVPKCRIFDTLIAHWFISPCSMDNGLKPIAKELWDVDLPTYKQTLAANPTLDYSSGKKKPKKIKANTLLDIPREALEKYGIQDSFYTYKLFQYVLPKIDALKSKELFFKVDTPLVRILQSMEETGVKIDKDKMKEVEHDLETSIQEIRLLILKLAGEEINLDSPKQLSSLLYNKLKLPILKVTGKTHAPSTDDETLKQLEKAGHEIAGLLVKYRTNTKILGTYLRSLPALADKNSRLHTNFNIHGTATGRLSSSDPNLQNIPKDGDIGKLIRKCFVPDIGKVFVRADFSQMELRMLAHISGDHFLIYALRSGEDLHKITAQTIFEKQDITDDERSKAKTVNFGIVYGQSPFGLAKSINVSVETAREYLQKYFRGYPLVREWKWKAISDARETKKITSVFNRVRELKLSDGNLDTIALNNPIQGACSDLVKIAMLRLTEALEPYDAKLILQVHDELIVECAEVDSQEVARIMKGVLESVNLVMMDSVNFFSKCPFEVEVNIMKSWGDK